MFPVLTTDNQASRDDLEHHALGAFGFLETSTHSRPRVVREPDRLLIQFVLEQVFVELELDWREGAAFTLVGAMVDSEPPSGYYVDDEGRRVRWHLTALLDEGGHSEAAKKLRAVTRNAGRDAMRQQIDASADALAPVLHEIPGLIRDLRSA